MSPESPTELALLRQYYGSRWGRWWPPADWHAYWLRRCCELALGGYGCVAPNPLVGAILLRPLKMSLSSYMANCPLWHTGDWRRQFEILGEGYHASYGQQHAEAAALAAARERGYGAADFRQAVLYCNLEPCSVRSSGVVEMSCCEQIIAAGVGAVVYGNRDPNPVMAGDACLRRAGILRLSGVFAVGSAQLNQVFFAAITGRDRPWVSLKLAQSLDACIATKSGHSQWITGPAARALVQCLRLGPGADVSCVAVGRATLTADDPSLLLRPQFLQLLAAGSFLTPENRRRLAAAQPWRAVWDSAGRSAALPLQFYRGRHAERSIVIGNSAAAASGVAHISLRESLHSAAGLRAGLRALARPPHGVQQLLLEGGALLASSFLAASLVDEVHCFVSQRFIGAGKRSLGELHPGCASVLLPQTLPLRYSSSMALAEPQSAAWQGPDEVLCHGYLGDILVP